MSQACAVETRENLTDWSILDAETRPPDATVKSSHLSWVQGEVATPAGVPCTGGFRRRLAHTSSAHVAGRVFARNK
ncbi:unnamed protein product [Protopolystoma xenopodis]|uniref:Uncharacterized protein n=1 Tax=Protopolystoma xenopodis TaxID=117903 RepID=A0A3S5FF06_9PLAT|nr:unnamed protein product [Protopolystoma xenopodis]